MSNSYKNQNKKAADKKAIIFRFALILFSIYMIYSMISLETELVSAKRELNKKQAEISEVKTSNAELKDMLENSSEDQIIEWAARDKLDFVFANEEDYIDKKGN